MNASDAARIEGHIQAALAGHDLARATELVVRFCQEVGPAAPAADPEAPWFRSNYLAVQVALAAGQPSSALERLPALLAVAEQLPPPLACHIYLLAAEARIRLNQIPEAREHLARLQSERSREAPLTQVLLLRLCHLRVRLWLGEVASLADELERCQSDLARAGDPLNRVLLLTQEGRAWDMAGDLRRAEQCWRSAAALLGRSPSAHPIHADVFLQLGRLEHARGQLQNALDHYSVAVRLAPSGTGQELNIALRRLMVLVDLNREAEARAQWQRLLGGRSLDALPHEVRSLAEFVEGLLSTRGPSVTSPEGEGYRAMYLENDPKVARQRYEEAWAQEKSPEGQARLAVALGLLALGEDGSGAEADAAEAGRWLERAEELAGTAGQPEVLWRALFGRGRLALRRGDEQQARQLFEAAERVLTAQAASLRHDRHRVSYRQQAAGVLHELLRDACRKGDAAAVFRCQELIRGRLLLEWRRVAARRENRTPPSTTPELRDLSARLDECEKILIEAGATASAALRQRHADLVSRHGQLCEDLLLDRTRPASAAVPVLPSLEELQAALPPGTVYVAPSLAGAELHLLVVRRRGSVVLRCPGPAREIFRQVAAWRRCLSDQLARYRRPALAGGPRREDLDACLESLGEGPLGAALLEARGGTVGERLVWVPSSELSGLPIHALRRDGRYLIEDHEVVQTFSGSLLVYHARSGRSSRRRRNAALVVTGDPEGKLTQAEPEGKGVAAAFGRSWSLHGSAATLQAIRPLLSRVGAVHFACHAYFDQESPLTAKVRLPSGEIWLAAEWPDEPMEGLPLMTLSACDSAGVAPAVGDEVFGLVCGLLVAGVRAVVGGLWPVADRETPPLMWRFYRHRLTCDLATALARAQRETLAEKDSSPLYWAVFALFGDAAALPPAGWLGRWRARRRQRHHASRFAPSIHGAEVANANLSYSPPFTADPVPHPP